MVDGRGKVKEYRRGCEEASADEESSVPVPCRMHDEKWASDECGNQCYTVADAVRDFFRSRLRTRGASEQNPHASSFLLHALTVLNSKVLIVQRGNSLKPRA